MKESKLESSGGPDLPQVVTTRAELRAAVAAARRHGSKIGLVPTMGALHAGHLSLVDASAGECDFTVVTIFVNPTQFGPNEDYRRYPRTLQADLELLRPHRVDLVFAPPVEEMYRPGSTTTVDVGAVAEPWEGRCRPGHFRGVATVVLKLFNLVGADIAYFGQKDYQQTAVIRRMVEDLDVPIAIRVCPTVRQEDGLALSSRNAYLDAAARQRALVLSKSLELAAELAARGERRAAAIRSRMEELFAAAGEVKIEYIALADPDTLQEVAEVTRPTLAAVAAVVAEVRLIDNRIIG
ncbi:MAG: pantoate--beta-alanine ligase [Pirellulales bacterium]